jgi:salicylate hydroxylase/6-hydroxynicotinate 3-monooxygenase
MAAERTGIAVIGAGIGGLTLAASLMRLGLSVEVYEQASQFAPIGAGIQLTANAMKALGGLGLVECLRGIGFIPAAFHSREWDTGKITNVLTMGEALEQRYGAPDLMIHRARLHSTLAALIPRHFIRFGRKLVAIEQNESTATLVFTDGSRVEALLVVGADGIHSMVREALFGAEQPRFTGRVAYRTTYPTALLNGLAVDERAKWWGPDRHVVHYFTTANGDEMYFIAVVHYFTTANGDEMYFIAAIPEQNFAVESWSTKGDRDTLLAAFAGCHPQLGAILAAAPELRKWALLERDPMPSWGTNSVVLLGDACHPMMPYMAQGAASAIEDAVVLARCLARVSWNEMPKALAVYAANRQERTARMLLTNRENTWLRFETDTDWVYDFDAWHTKLAGLENVARPSV